MKKIVSYNIDSSTKEKIVELSKKLNSSSSSIVEAILYLGVRKISKLIEERPSSKVLIIDRTLMVQEGIDDL